MPSVKLHPAKTRAIRFSPPFNTLQFPLRKRVEEIFGWMKTVGGFRRTRYRGLDRTGLAGHLVGTAYNLVRMAKLLGQAKEASVAQVA